MQRQSLGSPGSKGHGGGAAEDREERRRSSSGSGGGGAAEASEEEEKRVRPASRSERSIHLIPVLTLLCILVLYLCSHDPSPSDLASIGGLSRISDHKATGSGGADIGRWVAGGGESGLRGHRGLKAAAKLRHRKLRIL